MLDAKCCKIVHTGRETEAEVCIYEATPREENGETVYDRVRLTTLEFTMHGSRSSEQACIEALRRYNGG